MYGLGALVSLKERDRDGISGLVYTKMSKWRMNDGRRHMTFCRHLESAAGRLVATRRESHLLMLRGAWTTESARRTIVRRSSFNQGQPKWMKGPFHRDLSSLDMSDVELSWSRE